MSARRIKTSREIGERIKKKRKERGISQEELAEKLGVTYQQVQRYENGTNKLNVENIQVIADVLDVPVSYFFSNGSRKAEGLISLLQRITPPQVGLPGQRIPIEPTYIKENELLSSTLIKMWGVFLYLCEFEVILSLRVI